MKRALPMAIAIGVGLLVLLDRFVTNIYLDALGFFFLDIGVILAAFALLLGFLNVEHTNSVQSFEGLGGIVLGSNYSDFNHRIRCIDD